MDILNLIPRTYGSLILFILMMTRISFLFSTFSLFRRDFVNSRILIALSSILAIYAIIITNNKTPEYELFSITMISDLIFQAFIGFITGFVLNVLFEIFAAVGQIVSAQIGLSMATLIDPRLGAITPLTFLYNYLAIIIFFLLNGHLIAIRLILESFISIPIGTSNIPINKMNDIIYFTKNIFISGVSLSLTIIVTMLITNITIAVMTRFAPQFNIFTVGINITMIGGMIFIYLIFNMFVTNGEHVFESGFIFLRHILSRMN